MATPRIVRSPTCLSCLRRLAQPSPSVLSSPVPLISPWARTQTRAATTKAELEDLQGIPVRLLRDVPTFGRKHAIIRVKAGRMRNIWFPKGVAEYMTKKRFEELGLTEAAIGARDRNFGSKIPVVEDSGQARLEAWREEKKNLTVGAQQAFTLLSTLLPETLVFPRRAQPAPAPEPAVPRSPSLASNAASSTSKPASTAASAVQSIFGSVTRDDIVAQIKKELITDLEGSRVVLAAESVEIKGLERDDGDRIKQLGSFEILIHVDEKRDPVKRIVQVVPLEDAPAETAKAVAAES